MEYFDICDDRGNPVGGTVERSIAHRDGILHRTAHIWVVRRAEGRYQVLMQKRSRKKDSFPGLWDTSSAGHIQAGDEPLPSACRELSEELGISAMPEELIFAGTFPIHYEKEFHGKLFRDRETAFVYIYEKDLDPGTLHLQEEELEGAEWFDLLDTHEACKKQDARFCAPVGGLEVVLRYLGISVSEDSVRIQAVSPEDAEQLLAIYRPYVERTAITFEYEVPSVSEFRARIERTLRKYPYIKAVKDGRIVGYGYAGPFVGRAAYDWSVETSIYVAEDVRRAGVGKALYGALEEILQKMNIINLNACIGYPEAEDEYLTKNSVSFHAHLGYKMAGHFHRCGYKFGRWYDMVWMEKMLSEHPEHPQEVRSFAQVKKEILWLQ